MATTTQPTAVARIEATHKSDSPFVDALKRLMKNRFAVIGIVIILFNVVIALMADVVAPYHFNVQNLSLNNAAPYWVTQVFPVMQPGDTIVRINTGGEALVQTGDRVAVGDLLIQYADATKNFTASSSGMVYIVAGQLVLAPIEGQVVDLAGGTPQVMDNTQVAVGDALLDINGQTVRADIAGTAYVTDDRVVVRPRTPGYVRLSEDFSLGADSLGRDLLSRIIYGARVSLAVAFVGPLFAIVIGLVMGLMAGYFGGWVDNLVMRVVDVLYAFPTLLLIILMMAFFRGGTFSTPEMQNTLGGALFRLDAQMGGMLFIFIGVGLTSWLGFARLTRGQVLSVREQEYILAARAMGASGNKIMWQHILPNIAGPLIVSETLTIPTYIRYEAFLSFIGLGVNPPTPSWGAMISEGARAVTTYPNQAIFPALALFFIMFAFNFLGDGLRDALDPRMRGVK